MYAFIYSYDQISLLADYLRQPELTLKMIVCVVDRKKLTCMLVNPFIIEMAI